MKANNKIIGITGHPASGKDTVADYLVSKGFIKISGGDILREEMHKLNLATHRANIHDFVSKMRLKHGNGYLSHETIKRIKGNTVISGIRNREEVKIFRKELGNKFQLIAVDAPLKIRYKWAQERKRTGDEISFEQFKKEEEREKAKDQGSHEVDLVMDEADLIILNEGTKEDLFKKVDKSLSKNKEAAAGS
ncbi:MAG TPA: AAA family ATPase [Candidatus Paceibacterota bacterium]|nr:AAA family ATPase [Candidatus Paceibacterota bacterium]